MCYVLDGQARDVMAVAVSEIQSSHSMLSDLAIHPFGLLIGRGIGCGSLPRLPTRVTIFFGR